MAAKRSIGKLVPRGTIGQELLGELPEACTTCEERADRSKQPAAEFARRRLEQKKTRRVESNRENTKEVDADPPVSEVDNGGSESS